MSRIINLKAIINYLININEDITLNFTKLNYDNKYELSYTTTLNNINDINHLKNVYKKLIKDKNIELHPHIGVRFKNYGEFVNKELREESNENISIINKHLIKYLMYTNSPNELKLFDLYEW